MTTWKAWAVVIGTGVWIGVLLASARAQPINDVLRLTASHYNCRVAGQCSRSKITASGERFNENAMTCAHRTLPFGTWLRVCRVGKCVVVKVNDRGPFVRGRGLDLTTGAARRIGVSGVALVNVWRMAP